VLDAFAAGGAQLAGGSRAVEIEAAADVDYAWRSHAARFGVLVEHGRFQSERASNYLGTYTFATLADYAARQPAFFTRRVGNPEVSYTNTQAGVYVQDDIRVARSVLLSVGLRIEAQTLTGSAPALLPRGGIAWSPFRAGTTTVRAGLGAFADWLPSSVYEHSLVVDGVRQHDVRVTFPTYPAPPATNELFAPRERYAIGDDLRMQRSGGLSVGIEHQATPGVRLSASYGLRLGYSLLRGLNLNAPIEGRRPDPLFGNVIETRSDAASRSNTVTVQAVAVDPRRRVELTGIYAFTSSRTNTMGPFAPPSDGRIDNDWGTSSPAHIATGMLTARIAKRLTISLLPRWRSGSPYTVTTGRDDNHDGLFTDRPSGVERNAGRTPPQLEVGARLAYTVPFGTPEAPALPSAGGDPDSLRAGSVVRGGGDGREAGKRRLELFASAENVTNHPNYAMVSGVMSSPFFGQPTAATRARTIEFGVRFGF
jgi:hypothetical protein